MSSRIRMRRPRFLIALLVVVALVSFPLGMVYAMHNFDDVPNTNPFHADIDAIFDAGVTSGCGGGNFCPDREITRAEMAAFLNRLGALGLGKTPVVNADRVDGLNSSEFGLAGISVASDGTVRTWFNKVGGKPTVSKTGTGDYRVSIPGHSFSLTASSVATASVVGIAGIATVDATGGTIHVRTHDAAGTLTDRSFTVIVFSAGT